MADIKHIRHRLIIAMAVMVSIIVICIAVLLSSIGRGSREGRRKEQQLWTELQAKTRETVPLDGIEDKIAKAKLQIKDFYAERMPANFARVPERLTELASKNGVTLSSAHYAIAETEIPGVKMVRVDASIDGDYLREVRFINALERDRDHAFFLIDSISLGEQQKGGVHLQIVLETYIRSEAAS